MFFFQALDEPLEEALETRSVITTAALPDDVLKKINFNELFANFTTTRSSESSEALGAGIATSSTSSVAATGAAVAIKNMTEAATSSSDVSTNEQNEDGSGNISGT